MRSAPTRRHTCAFSHQRYLILAVLVEEAFWFWPPASHSTNALRLALERWADESAAGDSSDIRQRLRSALLAVATVTPSPTLAAFSAMEGLMERLNALDAQPDRTRMWRGWSSLLPERSSGWLSPTPPPG